MAQREIFQGITTSSADQLLHDAFYDWSHGKYPEATCIGDVVVLSGLHRVVRADNKDIYVKETE